MSKPFGLLTNTQMNLKTLFRVENFFFVNTANNSSFIFPKHPLRFFRKISPFKFPNSLIHHNVDYLLLKTEKLLVCKNHVICMTKTSTETSTNAKPSSLSLVLIFQYICVLPAHSRQPTRSVFSRDATTTRGP